MCIKWLGSIPLFFIRIFAKPNGGMTRRQAWFIWWQHHLPAHALSRIMGVLSNLENPHWFKNWMIQRVVKRYKIDLTEAVQPDPLAYPSFNAFFTRALQPEKRPIDRQGIVSPVDGELTQIGFIDDDQLFQAKGVQYDLMSLLGARNNWVEQFAHGAYASFYLSPKDYHRVHMPADGKLCEMIHVPGRLFSVNKTMCDHQSNLFARNERVINIFESEYGPMAVILIGAMLVGSINTVWCGEVTPPRAYDVTAWPYTHDAPHLKRGEQMGHFEMGSSVIILFGKNSIAWDAHLRAGSKLCYGQKMAS